MTGDFRDLPGSSRLFLAYLHDFPSVARFYADDPRDRGAPARLRDLLVRREYRRPELVSILEDQNRVLGNAQAALGRIPLLAGPQTLAVLTGQQTGLFGGPLYTLYKAISALTLASRLERDLGVPVLPLFWMTSEDHDLAEAGRVALVDSDHQVRTLALTVPPLEAGGTPAAFPLGDEVEGLVAELAGRTPETEFKAEVLAGLRDCFRPGETLARAFGRWMARLLGPAGLILVEPADARFKRFLAPLFAREVAEAPASSLVVAEAARRLHEAGFHPQVKPREEAVNLFLLEGGRRPIRCEGDRFLVRGDEAPRSRESLRRLAQETPEAFSPNVLLRPLAQDTLFPTVAYVAGPGEIAYFAQLRDLYARFEVAMPVIVPRGSLTVVEAHIGRLLTRYGLQLADLGGDPGGLASRLARQSLPPDFEGRMQAARAAVEKELADVGELVGGVDPTLQPTVRQVAGQVKGHLDLLERKAVQALKRRNEAVRAHARKLSAHLLPEGHLQERTLGIVPYLIKYGWGFVDRLRDVLDAPGWEHQLFTPEPGEQG